MHNLFALPANNALESGGNSSLARFHMVRSLKESSLFPFSLLHRFAIDQKPLAA